MTGRIVANLTANIRKQCGEVSQAAKEVVQACNLQVPLLDEEHAQDIDTAAALHADTIGGNYFKELPK